MKTPSAHREVLRRANELGYYPTPAQAKAISLASAEEYAKRGGANPVDAVLWDQCTDWATSFVMEDRIATQFRETLTGVADDTLAGQVIEAIKKAHGRRIRVVIEEV